MIEMKQMGIGLAIAVLVDATLVRIVILAVHHGPARPRGPGGKQDPAAQAVQAPPRREFAGV